MEQKERYELRIYAGCESYSITDTKGKQQLTIENVINLLNQQDKLIKLLEEEKKELEIKLNKCGTQLVNAESLVSNLEEVQFDYNIQNQYLKQQLVEKEKEQNQKAIEQLEKVKDKFGYKHNSQLFVSSKQLVDFIEQLIYELI